MPVFTALKQKKTSWTKNTNIFEYRTSFYKIFISSIKTAMNYCWKNSSQKFLLMMISMSNFSCFSNPVCPVLDVSALRPSRENRSTTFLSSFSSMPPSYSSLAESFFVLFTRGILHSWRYQYSEVNKTSEKEEEGLYKWRRGEGRVTAKKRRIAGRRSSDDGLNAEKSRTGRKGFNK